MRPRNELFFALVMVCFIAAPAGAAITVSVNFSTLTVNGSAGSDSVRVRFYDYVSGPDYTWVHNTTGVADPLPPSCNHISPETGLDDVNSASCEDGGTAPFLQHLRLFLGAGNDAVDLGSVFESIITTLGPGTDSYLGVQGAADTVFADDGQQDTIDCRGGADTAYVDLLDVVTGCAIVRGAMLSDGFEGAPP